VTAAVVTAEEEAEIESKVKDEAELEADTNALLPTPAGDVDLSKQGAIHSTPVRRRSSGPVVTPAGVGEGHLPATTSPRSTTNSPRHVSAVTPVRNIAASGWTAKTIEDTEAQSKANEEKSGGWCCFM